MSALIIITINIWRWVASEYVYKTNDADIDVLHVDRVYVSCPVDDRIEVFESR